MPPRAPKAYYGDATAVLRAALARGPLVRDRHHWRFGTRRFNNRTVAAAIAAGEATRSPCGRLVHGRSAP